VASTLPSRAVRARNAWIIAGIVVAVALGVWLVAGARPHNPATGNPDATSGVHRPRAHIADETTPGRPRSIRAPSRTAPPVAPVRRPEPPSDSEIEDAFGAEARDDAWAIAREAELAPRLGPIEAETGARVTAECRTRTCRIRIEADDVGSLGAAISRLEEPGGLHGLAETMSVGALVTTETGALRVLTYAGWARE
jgi:hypothetical protein